MVPNSFFNHFTVYGPNGTPDERATVRQFTQAWNEWIKEQSDLKPAILAELKVYGSDHKRIGTGRLLNFVAHSLQLEPTKENFDRLRAALEDLHRAGRVNYKGGEGKRNGRGTGWSMGAIREMTSVALGVAPANSNGG